MNDDMTVRDVRQTDLAGMASRFRRHIPVSAAIMVATMLLAGVGTHFMPRKYTANASMTFAPQASLVKGSVDPGMTDAARDAAIEAQLQIAGSLPVATQVIRKLDLGNDPALRARAGRFAGTAGMQEAMAAALLDGVAARRVGQTSLFTIGYTAQDPLTAARYANAFAEAYLANQIAQKAAQSAATVDQLDERVELLRRQAEQADARVAAFRVRNNLTANPDSASLEQEIGAIGTALAEARAQAALARTRSAASGTTVIGSGTGGVDTSTISRLLEQRATVSAELAGLAARYGDRHPQVIAARDRLADIEAQVRTERQQVSRAAGTESNAASARATSLAASLAAAQARLAGNVRAGVQFADLEREAETARQLYQNLLASRGEQTAQRALIQPDARLMAPATPPLEPSSPKLLLNLVIGLGLGLAIALSLAFLRERWTQTLTTVDDIDRLLGADFLNSIPTLRSAVRSPKSKDPTEAVMLHPMSAFAEAYRSLAATMIFSAGAATEAGGRVIGITSALPREGKTTTSIAVARVLAMGGTRVALVDADLRRRSVTQTLVPDAAIGWTDLAADVPLDRIAVEDRSGATILPIAHHGDQPQRPFDSDTFLRLLAELRQRYEVVVIDTAPVLALVDTRNMMPGFDALVLLAAWRQTPVKAIRAAIHQIRTVGGRVTGVALSMVDLKTQAQSGYGDASYYYKEMKDYYAAE